MSCRVIGQRTAGSSLWIPFPSLQGTLPLPWPEDCLKHSDQLKDWCGYETLEPCLQPDQTLAWLQGLYRKETGSSLAEAVQH